MPKGPVPADAVEQILTATAMATACEPGMPVLAGPRIEASPEAVTLTATDRHRLSTRFTSRVTVAKEQLPRALEEHPGERVALHVTDHGTDVRSADGEQSRIPLPATATGQPA
ncbi:DNA polymerase III subunit beta family protein [Streptomyces sp. NPDC003011]